MADEDLIPVSQKVRTIAHMNNDHRLDLQHILQHYNNLNDYEARDPEMVDINLQFMTVKTPHTGRTHYVKFEPELSNWSERRVKLVDMTHKARASLGLEVLEEGSHEQEKVVVKEYMPPRPLDWIIFLAVLFYYFNFFFAVKLGVLDGREHILDAFWPFGGHEGWMWLTKTIFWPVIGIHLAEAAWLERSRLSKYGVERGGWVWLLWMGSCFIEGGMSFQRFDICVEKAKEKQGKRQRMNDSILSAPTIGHWWLLTLADFRRLLCRALTALIHFKILHEDVKLDNFHLTDDKVMIVDLEQASEEPFSDEDPGFGIKSTVYLLVAFYERNQNFFWEEGLASIGTGKRQDSLRSVRTPQGQSLTPFPDPHDPSAGKIQARLYRGGQYDQNFGVTHPQSSWISFL
ncbi:hypothetical protein QBC36DRAFT_375925 [Triangularia setosa]|uniref:DUF2470 domain-containing protein n=1 Tax=Triangularia setosa TaxID=2587417 RepID=A0AAN6WE22_9PEZI|nr:hypothetical protein QBC36DRAFT_375925 [Podospora setosa]